MIAQSSLRALVPGDFIALPEPTLEVSFVIPAHRAQEGAERSIVEVHRFLAARYPGRFEIIVVPNGVDAAELAATVRGAEEVGAPFPEVQVMALSSTGPHGKGAAVRAGGLAARGRYIFFTDVDLPYELSFFDGAAALLRDGVDFVTGNRRLTESVFEVPVRLLPLVYRRHRISLACNRAVRWALGLSTLDTQCGIKAMSRPFAALALPRLICPGFLFDVELFLSAREHGLRHAELPVTFALRSEKSTVSVFQDIPVALYWLGRIAARRLAHGYAPLAGK